MQQAILSTAVPVVAASRAAARQAPRSSLALEPAAVVIAKAFGWWLLWLPVLSSFGAATGAAFATLSVWMLRGATKGTSRVVGGSVVVIAAVLGVALDLVAQAAFVPPAVIFALELSLGLEIGRRALARTGSAPFDWHTHIAFGAVAIVGLVFGHALLFAFLATPAAALRLAPRKTLDRGDESRATLVVYAILLAAVLALAGVQLASAIQALPFRQARGTTPALDEGAMLVLELYVAVVVSSLVAAATLVVRAIQVGRAVEAHTGERGTVVVHDGNGEDDVREVELGLDPALTLASPAPGVPVTLLGARGLRCGAGGPFRCSRDHVLADAALSSSPRTWRWALAARAMLYVIGAGFAFGCSSQWLVQLVASR